MVMTNETNQLSEREREILKLVASGLSNQQIANQLGISINTVKVHLRNVFGKIGAASRTEATMYAVRTGIITIHKEEQETAQLSKPLEPFVASKVDFPQTQTTATIVSSETQESEIPQVSTTSPLVVEQLPQPLEVVVPVQQVKAKDRVVNTRPARSPYQVRIMLIVGALALVLAVVTAAVWITRLPQARAPEALASPDNPPRWRQLPALDIARAAFGIATVADQVYVIGGENQTGVLASVIRYDARSNTWTALSNKPTPVADVRAVNVGGKIYVPGGRSSANPQDITDVVERYDPRTQTWESLPKLPAPRSAYALAALEGKVYLFGGWDGKSYRGEVFEFDPDQSVWHERSKMETPRAFADAAVVENSVFVLGGEDEQGALRANEVYIPGQEETQPWLRRAPMPEARSRFGTAVVLAFIHVVGGDPEGSQAVKYNVRTDSWDTFVAAPQAVGSQPGVIQQDELMLVVGGKLADTYSTLVQGYQALFTISLPQP